MLPGIFAGILAGDAKERKTCWFGSMTFPHVYFTTPNTGASKMGDLARG